MNRYAKTLICITAIIIISILFCLNVYAEAVMTPEEFIAEIKESDLVSDKVVITECKSEEDEQFIWDTLMKYLDGNEKITAAIMGYFRRESGLKSNALQNWHWRDAVEEHDTCAWYAEQIDKGLADGSTKEDFVKDGNKKLRRYGGYGLGQWYADMYLDAFFDFAQIWGTTISDAEMQCAFMVWSLKHQRTPTWNELQKENNIYTIGRWIGYGYDGASDLSTGVIVEYTLEYYKKYGTS